jgi:hypothetical protein
LIQVLHPLLYRPERKKEEGKKEKSYIRKLAV